MAVAPGLVIALAAGMMCWAMFLPFVSFPAYGSLVSPIPETGNLIDSPDARWIIVILIALLGAVAGHLAGLRRHVYAVASSTASVAAAALVFFEATDSGWRVLPGTWGGAGNPTPPSNLTLSVGYYVFLGGALLAVVVGLLMVVTSFVGPRWFPSRDAQS